MLHEEDDAKLTLTKPTLTKETFVDGNSMSLKDEAKIKADLEQEENNVVFREELCACNKRLEQMTDDTQKACALIMNNHCGKVMRNGIKEQADFETAV